MNLLIDPWIPLMRGDKLERIPYRDVLCRDEAWRITLPRDDMELATLQLLISLTQVLFPPDDARQLKSRIQSPLSEAEFDAAVADFKGKDWFELEHPEYPFMQTRGVKAGERTSMQKLFIGLPEGNNHALFNRVEEVRSVCAACSAIALFNQASNCPSFGGGFKGSLRGGAPITTLVDADSLRATIWSNALSRDWISRNLPMDSSAPDVPVWVSPIGKAVAVHEIGLLRGLFWQPAHVELTWQEGTAHCDCCGLSCPRVATGFSKEKFTYEMADTPRWPHPHSPRQWQLKKAQKIERVPSFTTNAPAWTQLTTLLVRREDRDKEGHVPAPVVSQFRSIFPGRKMNLIVGGYRNKQASVLERRHELFSLPAAWGRDFEHLEECIDDALQVKTLVRKKTYGFGKKIGVEGLANEAESAFYQDSEALVHHALRTVEEARLEETRRELRAKLIERAKDIFVRLTQPYQHDAKMLKALVASRRSLFVELGKLGSAS